MLEPLALEEPAPAVLTEASDSATAVEDTDLRGRVLGGFAWSMTAVGIMQASQIIVSFVLVRLLSPSDYGEAGMALLFTSLVLLIADLSMGAALVQRQEITEADCSTVFWTSAVIGALLTIAGIALSGPVAALYHQPRVQPLFAVASITFLLTSLQTTQASVLLRQMRFRLLNLRAAVAVVVGGVAGVTAAAAGLGAWSLIIQQLTSCVLNTVLLWICSDWRPRLVFSRHSFRELGGYGINMVGSNILSYARNNADNMLVGRFLGSAALGVYALAYNLMFLPLVRVMIPVQDTLFPALSRWQDDLERLSGIWLRTLRMLSAGLAPAMVGLAVVAPDFVEVIFGSKWRPATRVIQVLSIVAFAQCLALLCQRVLGAVDKTHLILRFSIADGVLTIAAFAFGLRWGIVGVSICYLAVSVPLQVVCIALTAHTVGATARRVVSSLGGVFAATAVMAAGCQALRLVLVSAAVSPLLRLVALISAGVLLYVPACMVFAPAVAGELRNVRSRSGRARSAAVAA